MKIIFKFLALLLFVALTGCGGSGGSSSSDDGIESDVDQTTTDILDGTTSIETSSATLEDLGDLVDSDTNTWWFTRAYDISDDGYVVGQTNAGSPVKAAFVWDPQSSTMTYLGKHGSTYDDYYKLEVDNPSDNNFIYSEAIAVVEADDGRRLVLGNSTTGTGWPEEEEKRAFLYDASSNEFIDLPPPSYKDDNDERVVESFSEAIQINKQGEVIITADGEYGKQAYYWDGQSTEDHTLVRTDDSAFIISQPSYKWLGRIIGQESEAVAINENKQVVINSGGTAVFEDMNDNAIEVLNFFPNESETVAVDLNDNGHVVGVSGGEGFFWRGGSMYPMGHLGGGSSEAVDVNNNDQVVGVSTRSDGTTHAVLWSLKEGRGQLVDLGTLGGANSYATAINDAGQIVGYSETGNTYTEGGQTVNVVHGFLWEEGVMYDLGAHNDFYTYPFDESFPLSKAVGINEIGDVVGNSHSINEHYRGFYMRDSVFD